MKRKPIRIDWDDLVGAFDNSSEELVYYLDLVSGHVVLDGEGEEDAFDDDDENFVSAISATRGPSGPDRTRAYIERLTTDTKIEWIEEFLQVEPGLEAAFTAALRAALDEDDPTDTVAELLVANPDAKDRWYRYRRDRLQERIDGWLVEHEVAFVDPPPWR
jgi:hypothetical protein